MKKPSYEYLEKRINELEEALKESEEQIQLITEGAELGIWYQNFETGEVVRNNQWAKMLGYKPGEIGENILDWKNLIHPDDLPKASKIAEYHEKGELPKFKVEHRLKTKSGEWKWILNWGKVIQRDENGKPLKAAGIHLDITELKNTEFALKESEEKFRNLAEQSPNLIFINKKGKVVYVNDRCVEFTGYSKEELYSPDFRFIKLIAPEYVEKIKSNFKKHLKGKEVTPFEYALVDKTGNKINIILITKLIKYEGEYAILGTLTDITERKKAEKVQQSLYNISNATNSAESVNELISIIHKEIGNLMEAKNFAVALYDREKGEYSYLYCFDEYDNIEDFTQEDFAYTLTDYVRRTGKPLLVDEKKHDSLIEEGLVKMIGTPSPIWIGTPLKTPKGVIGVITLQSYTNPHAYNENDFKLLTFVSDYIATAIERKQLEQTLKLTQFSIDRTGDAAYWMGPDAKFIYVNDQACESLGYAKEELLKMTVHDIDPDFSRTVWPAHWEDVKKRKSFIVESFHKKKDGTVFPVEIRINYLNFEGKEYNCAFARDISERKKSEIALKESEKRYRELFNNIADPIFIFDKKTHLFLDCNKSAIDKYGYSLEEIQKMTPLNLHPSNELEIVKNRIDDEDDTAPHIYTHVTKDGKEYFVEIHSQELIYKDSEAWISIVRDVTERKKAEKELEENEQFLKNIFDGIQDGVSVLDENLTILRVNDWMNNMYLSHKPLEGKKCYEVYQNRDSVCPWCPSIRTLKTGTLNKSVVPYPDEKDPKGWIEVYSYPLKDDSGMIYGAIEHVRDISAQIKAEEDKKKLEEQLFHAQKMESIGRLAGGVAHDFNNILTSIMGFAELLKLKFPDPSSSEGHASEIIIKSTERAADLTKQLLGFARGGKYQPVTLNINDVITEVLSVSEKIFDKKIEVNRDFEKNIWNVEADLNQLNQVFTNLIINARDAMPAGGELTLNTQNEKVDEKYLEIYPEFKVGKYVKITVSDTGVGMPKEVRERVFEPFFSTKGAGKGSGLGLATVYGIIKNHNGFIYVDSEPGKGSSFSIYLPAAEKRISKVEPKEPDIITGTGTIMIVDDEKHVRELLKNQLEQIGYDVILAEDGSEAVKKYRKEYKRIKLIMLDMIMPKLDGRDTFLKMKQINPDLKVLLISGYSQDEKATKLLNEGVLGFAQKPFKIDKISRIIQSVLNK